MAAHIFGPVFHVSIPDHHPRREVTIDGLRLVGENGFPGMRGADFVIIGNEKTETNVKISNVVVEGHRSPTARGHL